MKKFTSKYFGYITLVLAATIFSGCVTTMKAYSGPELPKDEIAIITHYFYPGFAVHYWTRLDFIDGEPASGNFIHVKPGFHTIVFSAMRSTGSGIFRRTRLTRNIELSFEARANHTYNVKATEESDKLYTWVDEVRTESEIERAADEDDNPLVYGETIRTVAGKKPQ